MEHKILHIDELCSKCGYFANNEPETHNGHDYGCDNPQNTDGDKLCCASACPLGWLADKAEDFMAYEGYDEEEAAELASMDEYVVVEVE